MCAHYLPLNCNFVWCEVRGWWTNIGMPPIHVLTLPVASSFGEVGKAAGPYIGWGGGQTYPLQHKIHNQHMNTNTSLHHMKGCGPMESAKGSICSKIPAKPQSKGKCSAMNTIVVDLKAVQWVPWHPHFHKCLQNTINNFLIVKSQCCRYSLKTLVIIGYLLSVIQYEWLYLCVDYNLNYYYYY